LYPDADALDCLQAALGLKMNLLASIEWAQVGLSLVLGAVAGFSLWSLRDRRNAGTRERERQTLLDTARREAAGVVHEARIAAGEEALRVRRQTEEGFQAQRRESEATHQRLAQRECLVNHQLEILGERERSLRDQQQQVDADRRTAEATQAELEALVRQRRKELERLAHLSEAEARALLLREVEEDIQKDASDLSRHVMEAARARAEEQARRIIAVAIQRYAGEHTFETTTATVSLNGDDLKGRIIGREGRNIRAFEAATGVTVLIDDTPNAVVLSGFDPVRREVARQAMERLIADGRIHPTRIEEIVAKVAQETQETILRSGEEAVFHVGLPPLPPDVARLLGSLRFRYSFSQNILDHSIEVAQLAGMLAAELGLDVATAKRAGLLHDIGKAINHEVEGCHAQIGADLLRRHGESEEIVGAVATHHDAAPSNGVLGVVVSAADAISASRPGARSESMATYLKRLEALEHLAQSFQGVERCYAVQAGREVRVFVHPETIDDHQAALLARGIARKIESELQYPGQIRVTVLRETRCVEFAK